MSNRLQQETPRRCCSIKGELCVLRSGWTAEPTPGSLLRSQRLA